jgi:hypothetical protein
MAKALLNKSVYKNIALLLIVIFFLFIVIETALRLFSGNEYGSKRFLFLTKQALQDQETEFGFKKNAEIREVAVYRTDKNFEIIYDTYSASNNLGLIQKKPFEPGKGAVVLIGDSFTQGCGASPWFYQLEERWQHIQYQLLNLSVMGTGVEQWEAMLRRFSQLAGVKYIFICFISQDWNRLRWIVQSDAETGCEFILWNQKDNITKNKNLTIYYIENNSGHEEILRNTMQLSEKNQSLEDLLMKYSKTCNFLKFKINNIRSNFNWQTNFIKNKKAFEQIISEYGKDNICLVHLPEKGEVMQGAYSPLGNQAKEYIRAKGLDYIDGLALCDLTPEDYHKLDAHPNAAGYLKIFNFFSHHVFSNTKFKNSLNQ